MQPYEPNGTFLGAPTKHVADPRSIESLVDFAKGNLGWIRDPDATATAKRKRASTNGFGHLGMTHDNSFDNGHVPVDPALGGNLRTAPSPASHGFTAVNAENEASSADVEGRFLPASTENREEIGSNSFGSVQAHLLIAQQDRMREAERGQEGSDRSRGVLGRGTEEEGHNSAIQSTAGHMGIELHPNSNIFNQTHYTPFDSNIAPWNSGHHPGSSSAMDHHFSGDQPGTHQPLTALEENPLAFIAAAGLLSLPGGDTSSSSQWPSVTPAAPPQELYTQPHLLEKVPPLPPATPTPTQPHHMEKDPSLLPSATPTPAQPHHMEMDPSLLPSATPTPAQPHHMEMDPSLLPSATPTPAQPHHMEMDPSLLPSATPTPAQPLLPEKVPPSPPSATPTPEKNPRPLPRRPRVKTEVNFGLNALRPERESQIGDWVRKTKAANRWTKNLKKKKTLIVKLHPPLEGFSILVDALLERDKVTSDLYSIGPGQFVTVFDAVSSANSNREPDESAPPKKKRGRPRKISRNVDPQSDSDEVAFIGAGAVATPADKEKSTQRRREAYLRRKKEEDEAKAQFLSATHHGVGKQEVLNMLRNQPEQFREGSDTEMYHFQPPPLPEETEEEKLARQALEEVERQRKAAEEEAVRIQREAEEEATRIQRQREEEIAIIKRAAEEAQRIAMEAERLRIQAEEKAARKAARAKLHAEEKERKRKEADRNAKLVAAGVLNSSDVDEYISSAAGDDDSFDSEKERIQSPQIPPGFDEFFDDFFPEDKKEALIPREWNFAVIIDPPSSDDGWRDSYTPLSRLSPDPPSLMASLPLIHTAPTQPQQPTRRRGRPRKHPLPTDNATVTPQSRPSTAKKPRTSRRKSAPLKGDSSFRAFRTQRNVQTLSVERGRRRSAVDVKKYSFEESEEETVARRPAKKRRISKVQVKPGKWAAVEITESEGEAEKKESLPADVEANRWEVIEGLGGGVRKESDGEKQAEEQGEGVDDAGMELGNEYEKRWNREKRKRWF